VTALAGVPLSPESVIAVFTGAETAPDGAEVPPGTEAFATSAAVMLSDRLDVSFTFVVPQL
jgi:hypothetical protein